MMRALQKPALIGLLLFILLLLVQFPAGSAFRLLAPEGVSGFGFSGTAWKGSARIISLGGQDFRNIEWDVSAWRLLTGRLAGSFKSRWANGFVEGFGSLGIGGTMRLQDTQAAFGTSVLAAAFGIPSVGGQANLRVTELELRNNWPYRLVGKGELRNFSSPLMGRGEADIIGDLALEFDTSTETDDATITAQLTDIGGPLELRGTLVLTPPGNYTLKARIRARPEAPEALRRNLEFLGPPEADGMHIFELAGSI